MAKARKGSVTAQIQSAARLARTELAARLLAHGFYAGQDQIMLALAEEDGLTPGQLALKLGVRPPTVTKTINRLAAQGFVEKGSSESDARVAHVSLTETGRGAIAEITKSVKRTEKSALRGLDKKERKTLLKLLRRVEANLAGGLGASEVDDGDEPMDEDA